MTKKAGKCVIYNVRRKREIEILDYNGITVRYIGEYPTGRAVYFYYGKSSNRALLKSVYISALEALLNGYDIIYKPQLYLSRAVEKAAFESPSGSIYAFYPKGLNTLSNSTLMKAVLTGGGAMSILEDDAFFSYEALRGTDYVASSMSDGLLLCSYGGKKCPHFIDDALGEGKSLGVLKSGLGDIVLKNLVRDGAECVDSFSSFLSLPRVILYPGEGGKYGIDGASFDILNL